MIRGGLAETAATKEAELKTERITELVAELADVKSGAGATRRRGRGTARGG